MRAIKNLIAQTYTLQTFRVRGVIQCCVAGEWSEVPVTEVVRVERMGEARGKALAQVEATLRRNLDPLALVRWHSPELVEVCG